MSIVGLSRIPSYDDVEVLLSGIERAVEAAGKMPVADGEPIALKINMCDARAPETGAITHPLFLDALLRYLSGAFPNSSVSVVESDATVVLADEFIRWFGYLPVIERWGARWVNLSKEPVVPKRAGRFHLLEVPVPKILCESKLISVSKLKTNSMSHITGSLKNQFGCLPLRQKSLYHDHLAEVIADVNLALRPAFSLVDGVLAMGGPTGPSFGVPVWAGVLLASRDPVAVDAAAADVIGFKPRSIKHIRLSAEAGLGSLDYRLVGDPRPTVDFHLDWLASLQSSLGRPIRMWARKASRQAGGKAA